MKTHSTLRKAFTLVEMLIVIAIIAVLASAVIGKFGQIQENGWATRCKANLKNLYQATLNYENDNSQAIPCAGTYEVVDMNETWYLRPAWVNYLAKDNSKTVYDLYPGNGWTTNVSQIVNGYPGQTKGPPPWYGDDATTSIRQGAIWDCSGDQLSAFICPRFARPSFCGRSDARRSYVMNGFFNCMDAGWAGWWQRNIQNNLSSKDPSRLPLFCDGGTVNNDGILHLPNPQTASSSDWAKPATGFKCVHKIAGKMQCQVVYLDGHVTATTNISCAACNGDE